MTPLVATLLGFLGLVVTRRATPRTLVDPRTGKSKRFVSRREAGLPSRSRAPVGRQSRKHWIVHHGVGRGAGLSLSACTAIWRGYYRYHTQSRGWTDIGYSFGFADAVDVGGCVFEGRGFGRNGGHTQNGGNTYGHACCFVGDGRYTEGSDGAWEAHRALLAHGVAIGAVWESRKITGHDDWWNKECPGGRIKRVIHNRLDLTATIDPVYEELMHYIINVDGALYHVAGTNAVHIAERDDKTIASLMDFYAVDTIKEWPGNADSFVDSHTILPGGGVPRPPAATVSS